MRLILVLAVLIAGTLFLPFIRTRRLALMLWGPVIVVDLMFLRHLIGPAIGVSGGGGPDAGYVGMAVGFYLAIAAPVCAVAVISLVVAGLCIPRGPTWNGFGIGAGIATSFLSAFGFLEQTTPTVRIAVRDEHGAPTPERIVNFGTFQFGSGRSLGECRTDRNGEARMRVPPNEWSAWVKSDDGVISGIGVGPSSDSFLEPNALVLTRWWSSHNWGKIQPRFATSGPFERQRRFELRLRGKDEITSRWMADELHRALLEAMHEGRHASALADLCNNLESLNEFPLLGQIAKKDATFARLIASVLDHHADMIDGFERMLRDGERGRWTNAQPDTYSALCRWLGIDEDQKRLRENAPKIRDHLQRYADKLLETAEPLWTAHGPVGFHLREYARSAAPRLLQAMEGKDEQHIPGYWGAVESSEPEVTQMEPFFGAKDRYVAAAAISAVRKRLSPAQAAHAAELLTAISHGENSWFQHQVDDLLLDLNARAKSEAVRE